MNNEVNVIEYTRSSNGQLNDHGDNVYSIGTVERDSDDLVTMYSHEVDGHMVQIVLSQEVIDMIKEV